MNEPSPDPGDGGGDDPGGNDGGDGGDGGDTGVPTSLSAMTKSELLDYAESLGIEADSKMKKSEIIDLIEG